MPLVLLNKNRFGRMPPAMTSAFAPTPAETTLVHQIFLQADPQKLGVVTGEAAVKVFDRANLSPAVLADIWAIADDENNGWLSRKGVAKAVRLIGHCQAGRPLSEDLLKQRMSFSSRDTRSGT